MEDDGKRNEADSFSIRIPEHATTVVCPVCSAELVASGPTGYWNETPICDVCMYKVARPLGATLSLIAVARNFARQEYKEKRTLLKAAAEVCVFAELYEQWLAPLGPPRLALAITPLGMLKKAEEYSKQNLN